MMNMRSTALRLALLAVVFLGLLAGCKPADPPPPDLSLPPSPSVSQPGEPAVPPTQAVRFVALSGPTGVGAAKLMADNDEGTTRNTYEITVVEANDQVTAMLSNGEADIAAIATNVACNLNNKLPGGLKMLAVNTLGVLYLLEKGDSVHSPADLRGKTLWCTGQGANPEYILGALLEAAGLTPGQDVTLEWLTPQEVSAKMLSSQDGICMLPVPAATALLLKDPQVRQAVDLSARWSSDLGGSLPMGCVVARGDFLEKNPQAVEDFLADYGASLAYMMDEENQALLGPGSPADLVAAYGLTASEEIAAAALPQCNLTFLTGEAMRAAVRDYFNMLYRANPASIGGYLPYDSFFYVP